MEVVTFVNNYDSENVTNNAINNVESWRISTALLNSIFIITLNVTTYYGNMDYNYVPKEQNF